MNESSSGQDNEVRLKRVLRVYRNSIVALIRKRMTELHGADAAKPIASLFGKKDAVTGKTQWEKMRQNADTARAYPEISTAVVDEFELLGVSDFYNVFEKYYSDLSPPPQLPEPQAVAAERKKGFMRCLQQAKSFRDPNAHDVTEQIDIDSLTLCLLNCKLVCYQLGLYDACKSLAELQSQFSDPADTRRTYLMEISDAADSVALVERSLIANKIGYDKVPISGIGNANSTILLVLSSLLARTISDESVVNLDEALVASETHGLTIVLAIPPQLDQQAIDGGLSAAGKSAFNKAAKVPLVEAYAEATAAKLKDAIPSSSRAALRPLVSVATCHAVHDSALATRLFTLMRDPQLKRARIVAPFATDIRAGALGAISEAMIAARSRGSRVSLVTRPPVPGELDHEKKQIMLRQLYDANIEVFLNPSLHSKVYLFEREPDRHFWAVGSHNFTDFAHGGASIEASVVGYRPQEYSEAQTAFERARRHPETRLYDVWLAESMQKKAQ